MYIVVSKFSEILSNTVEGAVEAVHPLASFTKIS